MACSLAITAVAIDPVTGTVFVTGTASGCSSVLNLTVTCGSSTYTGVVDSQAVWTGRVPGAAACDCGQPVTVEAVCSADKTCTATFSTAALCCCPQASTQVIYGSCTGNNELVSFNTTITINSPCTFTVQRDFANGSFGSPFTLTGPGTFPLPTEQSSYAAPAKYISGLNVISPRGCDSIETVPVAAQCGACHTSSLLAFLCTVLEFTFLLFGSVSLAVFMASPCVPSAIAIPFLVTALLALAIFLPLGCQQCICGLWGKFAGQLTLTGGIILVMFIPSPCAPTALSQAITDILLGAVLLSIWYSTNRTTCPLIICDLWCTVGGLLNPTACTKLAILGATLIWALTGSILTFGWFLSVTVAVAISIIAAVPLTTAPCNNSSPACQ